MPSASAPAYAPFRCAKAAMGQRTKWKSDPPVCHPSPPPKTPPRRIPKLGVWLELLDEIRAPRHHRRKKKRSSVLFAFPVLGRHGEEAARRLRRCARRPRVRWPCSHAPGTSLPCNRGYLPHGCDAHRIFVGAPLLLRHPCHFMSGAGARFAQPGRFRRRRRTSFLACAACAASRPALCSCSSARTSPPAHPSDASPPVL
jgi:hypothetical protein